MTRKKLTKIAIGGSLLSLALTLYILFGEHDWFEHRPDLQLEISELARAHTGEQVLQRHSELRLRCEVQQTLLGQQVCGATIATFNGIPAEHVAFYFDAEQNLTAWKLTVPSSAYPALREQLERRYGALQAQPQRPFLSRELAEGILAMEADPQGEATELLWLFDPRVISAFEG